MKYIEDGRSLVERNHDAREYCYQCRRDQLIDQLKKDRETVDRILTE